MYALFSILYAKDYKGAELRTKEAFTYGRFEVNFKPPAGQGLLASFFTYHDGISGVEEWNEIDIEILGRYEDNIQLTTITPGQSTHDGHFYVPFHPHEDFHTYGFEWTPDYVAWFADGQEIYRQSGDHIATLHLAQKIMMNIWIPQYEEWVGEWNPQLLPKFAYYDWVSYASYTPGQGNTGTDNNFTLQWKDDFNDFDSTRWEKASHTWNGNLTDFKPENVVFRNGKMILCLTDKEDLGLIDKNPPYVLWARATDNRIVARFSEEIDTVSALDAANYFISGLTIKKVELLPDQQTVVLKVSDMDSSKTYSLVILGIRDASADHNKQIGQVIPITMAEPLTFPVKINTGGGAIYNRYLKDRVWNSAVEYGHMDGHSKDWTAGIDISGTDQDSLYITELQGAVKYKIRVPNGSYNLTFHFAENEYDRSGQRIFDLVIEDSLVSKQLDLVSKVGVHTAYDLKVGQVKVTDGIMDIHLMNRIGHSMLNGITVEQVSTGIGDSSPGLLQNFKLFQSYPNPSVTRNHEIKIKYQLPGAAHVKLTLYNVLGQVVGGVEDYKASKGIYELNLSAADLSTGLYFYKLDVNQISRVRKLMVIR